MVAIQKVRRPRNNRERSGFPIPAKECTWMSNLTFPPKKR